MRACVHAIVVSFPEKVLTKTYSPVIILWQLRECWNGRQARLRCVWLRRGGSSPLSRTRKKSPFGALFLLVRKGGGMGKPLTLRPKSTTSRLR